jgi:hypothetical protein
VLALGLILGGDMNMNKFWPVLLSLLVFGLSATATKTRRPLTPEQVRLVREAQEGNWAHVDAIILNDIFRALPENLKAAPELLDKAVEIIFAKKSTADEVEAALAAIGWSETAKPKYIRAVLQCFDGDKNMEAQYALESLTSAHYTKVLGVTEKLLKKYSVNPHRRGSAAYKSFDIQKKRLQSALVFVKSLEPLETKSCAELTTRK